MNTHIQNMVHELGLEDASVEDQQELISAVGEVAFNGAMRRVWKMLAVEQQDELTTLLDMSAGEPESKERHKAVISFLDEHVPSFREYLSDEIGRIVKTQKEVETQIAV